VCDFLDNEQLVELVLTTVEATGENRHKPAPATGC
jgi:hypothetical protein